MSHTPRAKEAAMRALCEQLGYPVTERPALSPAVQQVADLLAGRTANAEAGTAAAELDAALAAERAQPQQAGATRAPSDEMRAVIEDVLRTMHARGELE